MTMRDPSEVIAEQLAVITALVAGDRWLSADACAVYLGMPGAFAQISVLPDFPSPVNGKWSIDAIDTWADATRAAQGQTTCLYRHFDSEGALLYVGISLSAVARLIGHKEAAWFHRIAQVTIERHPTRPAALAAERAAIKAERPRYNRQGASNA